MPGPFDAFLTACVRDSVNGYPDRRAERDPLETGERMTADEYLALSPEQKAEDARIIGARAMERREVMTRDEAGAYGAGLAAEPRE